MTAVALLMLALWVAPARAQEVDVVGLEAPSGPWKTLRTRHFELHFPAPFEAWALHLARRMEAAHSAVSAAVGWDGGPSARRITVLLGDPLGEANGLALPLLGSPVTELWTTPPRPEDSIGVHHDWAEFVFTHELVHLLHLGRPRTSGGSPWLRLTDALLPIGPLARVPRWVSEGYATVLEGELTGSGRPHSAWRAAFLRQWASAGRLPSYPGMSGGHEWYSHSYAYWVGSAYLEWLERREGRGSLMRLWKAAATQRGLSFEEAFRRTFGESPAHLYQRFLAETTAAAVQEERRLEALGRVEGERWQRLEGTTGAPALSADGKHLVVLRRPVDSGASLEVYPLEPTEEERRRWAQQEEQEALRLQNPEEVPDKRVEPRPREARWRLSEVNGRGLADPRFMPDGRRLVYVRKSPDGFGVLHNDVWLWDMEGGGTRALTHVGDVRMPEPCPDGRQVVAVRHRFGRSELVRVDVGAGQDSAPRRLPLRLPPEAEFEALAYPRVSPDGQRLAFLWQRAGRWQLALTRGPCADVESGAADFDVVPLEAGRVQLAGPPAWHPSGNALLVASDRQGTWNLEEVPVPQGALPVEPRQLTRVFGAALSPAPTPDGASVFFLSITPTGADVHRLGLTPPAASGPGGEQPEDAQARAPHPLYPPASSTPRKLPVDDSTELVPRPYRTLGALRWSGFLTGAVGPSGSRYELVLGGSDRIGRLSWTVGGGWGRNGESTGAALAARLRGLSLFDAQLRAFVLREQPGRREQTPLAERDRERLGGELLLEHQRTYAHGRYGLDAGVLYERGRLPGTEPLERRLARAGGQVSLGRGGQDWGVLLSADVDGAAGATQGSNYLLARGELSLEARTPWGVMGATATEGRMRGAPSTFDTFTVGGVRGSLSPEVDEVLRLEAPALATALLSGRRLSVQRATWETRTSLGAGSGYRVGLFGALLRAGDETPEAPLRRMRALGLSGRLELSSNSLFELGGRLEVRAELARLFDDPLRGRWAGFVGLTLRP